MSEVTRAEQLANELEQLACSIGGQHVLAIHSAKELRRLSAVEARQAELIQQAKEAMQELNRYYSHIWDRVDCCAVILPDSIQGFESAVEAHSATISAINDGGKSNG